jgi:hypothetical protein
MGKDLEYVLHTGVVIHLIGGNPEADVFTELHKAVQ